MKEQSNDAITREMGFACVLAAKGHIAVVCCCGCAAVCYHTTVRVDLLARYSSRTEDPRLVLVCNEDHRGSCFGAAVARYERGGEGQGGKILAMQEGRH